MWPTARFETVWRFTVYKLLSHDYHGLGVRGLKIGVVEGSVGENEVEGGTVLKLFFGICFCFRFASLSCYKNMKVKKLRGECGRE